MAKMPAQNRTPIGGMNQDDSLITPSLDAAGKNMFEGGDYRYALNARIGSSRSDHFGDLENIRDTVEVTTYYAPQQIFENTDFEGSLDDWSQLDESAEHIAWIYNNNAARLTLTPDTGPVPEAPEYISKSTKQTQAGIGGAAASVNVSYPPGIQAGDLLIAVGLNLHPGVGSTASVILTPPTGWVHGNNATYVNNLSAYSGNLAIFTREATGSESGTVEIEGFCDANFTVEGQIYLVRSLSGDPVLIDSITMRNGDGGATITFDAVTVSGIHRTLIAIVGGAYSTPADPTGYQESTDDATILVFSREDISSDGSVTTNGGGLDGWATSHLSVWAEGLIETDFISEVLYQTTPAPIAGQNVTVQFGILASSPIDNGLVKVVFLNGTTIIEEETVYSGTISSILYNELLTAPPLTNGIGIRISGTISVETTLDLDYFTPIATILAPGSRPAGTEKVIGKYEDYEFQRLYYCVWNSLGNHCIRYWDASQNIIVEVMQWSGLNWLSTTFVKMSKLDNWMSLTDRRNAPRLIDVDTIGGLRAELGDEFREFHIAYHKWAPTNPPVPRIYYDGVTNNFEKLKNKVFHFSFRYIYKGNLKSKWSPISKGATTCNVNNTFYANDSITAIELDIPGALLDVPGANVEYNYFDHNDIKFTAAVKSIEIAFRDGEVELWKLWKRIPVNPSFNRLQYFNGEGLLTPVAQEEFEQPFDTVPFLAGTVEAIDNRFVFGDCLDEKDPFEDLQIDDVSSQYALDEWNNPRTSAFPLISADPRAKLQRLNALSNLTFKDRAIYKLGIQFLYHNGWRSGVYTTEEWLYDVPDIDGQASGSRNIALQFTIPSSVVPPDEAVGYQIMRTNALNISYYMFGIVNEFVPLIDDVSLVTDKLTLPDSVKERINQHFANVQNISGQEVIEETQRLLEIEIAANTKKDKKIRRRNRLLRANRLFEQSSTGTQTHSLTFEKWLRRNPIGPVLQQELRKTKTINVLAESSRIYIDINNWVYGAKKNTVDQEYPLNKLFYNYTPGDRVRFVGSESATPTSDDLREYDVPIVEYTGKGIIIERPESLAWISTPDEEEPRNFNIEVYTPHVANESDHIFYETGEWYPILYPGHASRNFSKRDFVYTAEADVTLSQYGPFDIYNKMPIYYGDSYGISKTVYRDNNGTGDFSSVIMIAMNPDPNKTFDRWDKNNGRVSIAYEELPVARFKPTQAKYSGKIVEESFVNELNTMRDEDQFIYPSEYGRIRDLVNTANAQVESVGSILLAIGERESWSIYVNRTTLEDLSGRTQVMISDEVLGSYNALLGSHGTLNPESVSKSRGRIYWWDAVNGAWMRYGRDGLTEISQNKMRNWYSELGDLMITKYLTDELPVAISEFDKFNDELIVYQNHSTLPATFRGYSHYKGALFSETDKRWKSCHNFAPEMMGKINKQVIMFLGGSPFLYEKGTSYSTFFGVKYNVQWEPVFNDTPELKKAWRAIEIIATNKWSVERILSEYRGLRSKQQTSITLHKFVEKEDNYYSDINRDVNTPNGDANVIVEGDLMRSKAIQVLMQLDPAVTYESLLHHVFVQLTDSAKNPVT